MKYLHREECTGFTYEELVTENVSFDYKVSENITEVNHITTNLLSCMEYDIDSELNKVSRKYSKQAYDLLEWATMTDDQKKASIYFGFYSTTLDATTYLSSIGLSDIEIEDKIIEIDIKDNIDNIGNSNENVIKSITINDSGKLNNVEVGSSEMIMVTSSTEITGVSSTSYKITIYNSTSKDLKLSSNSSKSSMENRFDLRSTLKLKSKTSVTLFKDNNKWKYLG
jgi:hypothetical protein